MKSSPLYVMEDYAHTKPWLRAEMPLSQPGALRLVSAHEVAEMEAALAKGRLPMDFEAKLDRLAGETLLHRSVEQNCRLFIALVRAVKDGAFKRASEAERERLLRVLAYVRKDDDAIPDYKPGGFVDDQREVRAAAIELGPLLEAFKSWRLQHQVPALWRTRDEALESGRRVTGEGHEI